MIRHTRYIMLGLLTLFTGAMIGALAFGIISSINGDFSQSDMSFYTSTTIWSLIAAFGLVALMSTRVGEAFAIAFLPIRDPSLRENGVINPALERVQQLYKEKFRKEIKLSVYVMDIPHINGMAFGKSSLAVSKGLLKVGTEDEIAAIIAHEVGHLHHKDGFLNLAALVMLWPILFLGSFFKNFFIGIGWGGIVIFLTGLFFAFLFVGHFLVFWICSYFIVMILRSVEFFTEWPVEYKADHFATELGLGASLVSVFEQIEDEDIRQKSGFFQKYAYSHPPTALRIDRIERHLLQSKD